MRSEIKQNVAKRANRVLEIAADMAKKFPGYQVSNRIEEIQLHFDGYAKGQGYTTPECGVIATGNWNVIDRWNEEKKGHDLISDLPKRIGDIFEKLGIEIEWSDEWSTCSECYKLIRTNPDSYSWQPAYWLAECEIKCLECVEEDIPTYLEAHEGGDSIVQIESIDPADHEYVQVNEDSYESGWHPGQTDDPRKVAEELREKGIKRFLFKKDEQSQFYSKWSVYVHESEEDKLASEE